MESAELLGGLSDLDGVDHVGLYDLGAFAVTGVGDADLQ